MTLLDAARRMNRDALAEIFDLYSPAIYKYALRLSNDAILADYVVGDVFAKLLDHFSAGNGPGTNLRAYLYQMTYHVIIDEMRYWKGLISIDVLDFFHGDEYSTDISLENRLLFERVSHVIRNDLTDYQRHVIILRFLEGFSLRETAAILGKTANIIKAVQNRAIIQIREALGYQVVQLPAIPHAKENHQQPFAF